MYHFLGSGPQVVTLCKMARKSTVVGPHRYRVLRFNF